LPRDSILLSTLSENDKIALGTSAKNAKLENWREDPIGKITEEDWWLTQEVIGNIVETKFRMRS
jgi:hypothetical protein